MHQLRLLLPLALLPVLLALECPLAESQSGGVALPGLTGTVRVLEDGNGVPHIYAQDDADLVRVQGWIHARDRFWKMDITRRQVDGTLAELVGSSALGDDTQMRVIGLARAAQRSFAILSPHEQALLQAYADGVNDWIAAVQAGTQPLPPEYTHLELSAASLRPWTPIDTLAIGKGIAASLSLDIDAGLLEKLQAYCSAGASAQPPFDGARLLFDDVQRIAPMDPAATVPDAGGTLAYSVTPPSDVPATCDQVAASATPQVAAVHGVPPDRAAGGDRRLGRTVLAELARFHARAARTPLLAAAMERREREIGSNEWGTTAAVSKGHLPMIANDPHLSLGTPPEFYENHLVVAADPDSGPMNVSGVTFPGVPFVILGQNDRVTWGATTNSLDVTDLYSDEMVAGDPGCKDDSGNPTTYCIDVGGVLHPVILQAASYLVNQPNDGIQDHLVPSGLGLTDPGSLILTVPYRSFGPIVDVADTNIFFGGTVKQTKVLTLQYTGFQATREVETFRIWNRARNLADFRAGLDSFDFGSQNWAYADSDGNLGYFTSAELPLREDLEAGHVAGLPPFFVRDGASGLDEWVPDPARSQGQAIPYAILPYDEMPQVLNPPNGFFANANNDAGGTNLDNDPLNQRRLSKPGAIYYLAGGYAQGLRAGRITRLLKKQLASGQPVTMNDLRRMQRNTQELDAELLVPFLLAAFQHASAPGAPAELAAYAADSEVADAVTRLSDWDDSTPTGIPEGWDASDPLGRRLATVPDDELRASVAATIYNLWRGQLAKSVIDARLSALGVSGVGSGDALVGLYHLLSAQPYTGVGASGVDFIPEPATLDAGARRDVAILAALRGALDLAASPAFAPAFGGSTNPDDWHWGRLHRITFAHELGGDFSIPPAAGFEDLAPDLPGLARDGGYETVNVGGYSAEAAGVNAFRFGSGSVRRYVGAAAFPGPQHVLGFNVVPSVVGDPPNTLQMRYWLTGDQHTVQMDESAIAPLARQEIDFTPPGP
jgi:penicillin amidase